MILTKEDYNGLLQVLTILNSVIRNAVMSEQEEQREREFTKQFDGLITETAFAKITKELKRMPKKFIEIFNREWFEKHLRRKPVRSLSFFEYTFSCS